MWFKSDDDIDTLIAKGKLNRAAKLLREQLQSKPKSTRLRQQLGDVLGRAGKPEEAISVLAPLVHEFAKQGFSTKAIAVVKKIQRLDPGRKDTDQLVERVIHKAEAPLATSPPLVHGHLSSEPEYYEQPESQPTGYSQIPGIGLQTPTPSPEAEVSKEIRTNLKPGGIPKPEATSKLESNWMEQAAARADFHWSPILNELSQYELSGTIGKLNLLTKHAGSIIYGKGDPADSLFILATGFARAFDRYPGEPYRQTMVFEEGQFFGEEAFFAPENGRKTTVTAAYDCELLELDLATLRKILQEHHSVLDQLEGIYRGRPWTGYELAI